MSVPGILKLATVLNYNSNTGMLNVVLNNSTTTISGEEKRPIQISASFYSSNGLFIGGIPEPGTPIIIGQGEGGKWYFVAYVPIFVSPSRGTGNFQVTPMPILSSGELLIQQDDTTKISLKNSHISLGSLVDKIDINTNTGVYLETFDTKLSFTEAGRHIFGALKRDLTPNKFQSSSSKLNSPLFDNFLKPIGLDPKATPKNNSRIDKNPIFVENRELLYEFMYSSNVTDEVKEASLYTKSEQEDKNYILENRRKNRSDTLSLSLLEPNYLMEIVKGTVVDIFGNILDINRTKIPVGGDDLTLQPTGGLEKDKVYQKIRELQRKSIAYHFEINARKDFKGKNGTVAIPSIDSNDDFSRNRSRFFFDIDKEGLIKINVPASSEFGNIPLLVRYENYSSYSKEDDNNPNQLIKIDSGLDIFLDSFAFNGGTIEVVNSEGQAIAGEDRIRKGQTIKHGTVFHDILKTCEAHQSDSKITDIVYEPYHPISAIKNYTSGFISPKITIGQDAGGRSGSINFDGSIELNVGANTIDRQSVWLDTAGSIVGNIGRDKNFVSAAISLDGDLIMQVGGTGVSGDSRFSTGNGSNTGLRAGNIDIRVLNSGGKCTLINISDEGVKILTPGNMILQSQGDFLIRAGKTLQLDGEVVFVHERNIQKFPPNSIK